MEETSSMKPKRKDTTEDKTGEETAVPNSDGPQKKLARLNESLESASGAGDADVQLALNKAYQQKDVTQWLQSAWTKQAASTTEETTGAQIYGEPFQISLLPNFLEADNTRALVDEMINKVHWSRKQMDLYEFYQSTDLSNMLECRLLTNFLQMLRKQVRPWLEDITNLKLDYVSASCSMYSCGDYLLVHDDLLKDRQIAFIYYLSPWQGVEEWSSEQGGCLEIFSSDEQCYPQFPVQRKIAPKNNQFAFFKVGSRSFHQVGEVTTFDYPRLTINGWFHGATNEAFMADSSRAFPRLSYLQPNVNNNPRLGLLLNDVYLKAATRRSIQKRIEENSEICLYEFFKREKFELARAQLLNDESLSWRRQGPANAHNYEVMDLDTAKGTVQELLQLFRSNAMFQLLRDFTDLDLYGVDAITPTCSVELQRWSHGNYTVLGDGLVSEENTLDLVYYLNAAEGAAVITYLSPDVEQRTAHRNGLDTDQSIDNTDDTEDDEECQDDSVLLTITPVDNALNIVYRCEGTTKFTKYVSRNTPLDKGPVFVISCSYKE
ncbi:PREDICTED: prolyl 3-hydroxylase sudestada1-like isoform X1 [Drosophila arizonae]|uniref:Prolyl 3-hydroxylase sudestada1-like isoform X1 n=1 Tax=Drosophila arizonae TaxID=7263 RepID=A0ABM1Q5K8_DROAR|nr:PREDICTED: prolyl 3-hydroxylase sudestada1-like isoform X1 [Drosophila arizonae]